MFAAVGCGLVAVGCGLAIAGCGFTGNSSEAASSGGPPSPAVTADLLKFATCMRSHGVPNFPDPSTSATAGLEFRGVVFPVGPDFDPQSPAFKQAQAACGIGPSGTG